MNNTHELIGNSNTVNNYLTMKNKIIKLFQCPICKETYTNKEKAIQCLNSSNEPTLKVGDIVEAKFGFGWYRGDKRWVINPDVDTTKHGFDKTCSFGFYYVITAIEEIGHRKRYHLFTNAMLETTGYGNGYTFDSGHHQPQKINNPPAYVVKDSKNLIGKKAKYLL